MSYFFSRLSRALNSLSVGKHEIYWHIHSPVHVVSLSLHHKILGLHPMLTLDLTKCPQTYTSTSLWPSGSLVEQLARQPVSSHSTIINLPPLSANVSKCLATPAKAWSYNIILSGRFCAQACRSTVWPRPLPLLYMEKWGPLALVAPIFNNIDVSFLDHLL
jgi:hypothetical protein